MLATLRRPITGFRSSCTPGPLVLVAVTLFVLLLTAGPGHSQSQSKAEPRPEQAPLQPRTSMFQIVAVVAEKAVGKTSDDMPRNVQKALDDIREFLPYKSFRLIDAALVRSEGESVGRIGGASGSGHKYEYTIEHSRSNRADDLIQVRRFGLTDMNKFNRRLLGTSFSVREKETIVVGTSKLDGGDQALIVLFTALE